jgi:hypothetical protein
VSDQPTPASRLFQIHEEDLADLERTLPQIADGLFDRLTPKLRTQCRRMQDILSRVRWNYGPPQNVKLVEPGEPDDPPSLD